MSEMNMRRVIRVTRLLAELGHVDVIDALEELKALRPAPAPFPQQTKGKYESQAQFNERIRRAQEFWRRMLPDENSA